MRKLYIFFFIFLAISSYDTTYSLTLPTPTIYTQHCDTLFWSKVTGATSYRLHIVDTTGTPRFDSTHIPDTFFVFPCGFYFFPIPYDMRVKALSPNDSSNWSYPYRIIFNCIPPRTPIILGINDSNTTHQVLYWSRPLYAIKYRLQIATDPIFISTIINMTCCDTFFNCVFPCNTHLYSRVNASNYNGTSPFSNMFHFILNCPNGLEKISTEIPNKFELFQNYPNPFNPTTKIRFFIPDVRDQMSEVRLVVYNILGREVVTLVNEKLSPGSYEVEWDGTNYASGVYFYKLTTTGYTETKKLILLK